MAADFETFLRLHEAQLVANNVPELYWSGLYQKITSEVYDAGSYFSMAQDEDAEWHVLVSNEIGLKKDDPMGIFLVDHAWTFQAEYAKSQLQASPNLLSRMANLVCIDPDDTDDTDSLVGAVMQNLWKYSQTYKVAQTAIMDDGSAQVLDAEEQKLTIWYIMDEFGSRFAHSDKPKMAFKHFYHIPTQISFTIIFPIEDISYEEEATRDYVGDITDPSQRDARLYSWNPERLNFNEISDDWLSKINLIQRTDRCSESLEIEGAEPQFLNSDEARQSKDKIFNVYTDQFEVKTFLTNSHFKIVQDAENADILWLSNHFKDFKSLHETPWKIVNQFPSENILTCKDLMAEVAMRSLNQDEHDVTNDEITNRGPLWLPTTYNLYYELPKFIKCFKEREEREENNIWMVKPWNLGRGLQHTVTDNLDQIIKLADTGPKVACKYIDDPVLFNRDDVGDVKFDIRYMVLLNSIQPLQLYLYKIFYTRFANIPFSLADFEKYEKHLTVMNYRDADLKQIHWNDFILMFEKQYPEQKWSKIEIDVFEIIKKLFKSAVSQTPPNGLGHHPQCRAMYGLDFMYKWIDAEKTKIQPMLIEVNFNPSIERCCKYQPHLVNDFFETMFLGIEGEHVIKLL